MKYFFSSHPTQPTPSRVSQPLSYSPCNPRSRSAVPTKISFGKINTSGLISSTGTQHTSAIPEYALGCGSADEEEDDDDYGYDVDAEDVIGLTAVDSPRSPSTSSSSSVSSTLTCSSEFHAAMSIRDNKAAKRPVKDAVSASHSPSSTTASHGKPTTPTSPVEIPKPSRRDDAHCTKRGHPHRHSRRQHKRVHCPDAISPSVAALLAITDIPRPQRRRRLTEDNSLPDDVVSNRHVCEKAPSLRFSRGPLDLLLSPPEDLADDELSATESSIGSLLARTASADSVPSLGGESCASELCSSPETPGGIMMSARRRRSPVRKSLEPIRSPPDAAEEHPLIMVDDVDFKELEVPCAAESEEGSALRFPLLQPFKPLSSAFKSNLTASLRALRAAAKSFSGVNLSCILADDFLTRSILTIDPNVPYMDECRPPVTEEMPSAELRRYLNPTTSSHLDHQSTERSPGAFSASIQLQTYKVQRSRRPPPSAAKTTTPYVPENTPPSASPKHGTCSSNGQQNAGKAAPQSQLVPGMRQREMRENPDFIRIAVMEMAMRRRGKLDQQKPGRARWALPPRRPSAKPYEVSSTGVPTRWIPVTH